MGFKLVKWIEMDCLYVLMGKNDAEMEHYEFPCYKWMNMSMKPWKLDRKMVKNHRRNRMEIKSDFVYS